MAEFNLSKPNRTIHVGVILMNSMTEALDIVPVDLLHGVSEYFIEEMPALIPDEYRKQGLPIKFHWVSEQGSEQPRKLSSGLNVIPTDSFTDCPVLDIVLVGAHHVDYIMTPAEVAYVQKAYAGCHAFMTVCGGVQVGVQADLFAGKTVTGPRYMLPQLRAMVPEANWVTKRYVQDGKLWTTGALVNGLDMMAAFMKQTWSAKATGETSTSFVEYGLHWGSSPDRDINYKDELPPASKNL